MKAISIRQPWAWLILNAGKDIENRSWPTNYRGRVLIHAAKTMTQADYEAAKLFCCCLPNETLVKMPYDFPSVQFLKTQSGGIVGEVEIVDCVIGSPSPWFCGEYGFRLRNAKELPFQPCKGALGFFNTPNL